MFILCSAGSNDLLKYMPNGRSCAVVASLAASLTSPPALYALQTPHSDCRQSHLACTVLGASMAATADRTIRHSNDFKDGTGNDLIDSYQLNGEYDELTRSIEHRRYFSDRKRGIRNGLEIKRWRRDGSPIGYGGFGTVWREKDQDGEARAVKQVRKTLPNSETKYYLRELLAMAALSKVSIQFTPDHLPQARQHSVAQLTL